MNLFGSYRAFLRNSKSAILAAIEIYNKPTIQYREECFVILLINAWELLLKAMLSKARRRIYYPKKRGQPYRTLDLFDSLNTAKDLFPTDVPYLAIARNLDRLFDYRNKCVHFYNKPGFASIVYALAQTSVLNYRDVLHAQFNVQLGDEITYVLLPISLRAQLDPIEFIRQKGGSTKHDKAVAEFLAALQEAVQELSDAGIDPGRLLTTYRVSLQSVKKISQADVTVGVEGASAKPGTIVVEKRFDPNDPNWVRQKDIIAQIDALHGINFTSHVCQALVWKYNLKDDRRYCWRAREGVLTKYSNEVVVFLRSLSESDVDRALRDYKAYMTGRRKEVRKRKR